MAAMRLPALLALVACAAGSAIGSQRGLGGRLAEEERRSATVATASLGGFRLSAERTANLPSSTPKEEEEEEVVGDWTSIRGFVETLSHKLLARLARLRGAEATAVEGNSATLGVGQDVTLLELLFILGMMLMGCCVFGCCCLCCSSLMGAAVVYNVRLSLLLEERDRLEKRMPRTIKEKVAHPDFRVLSDHLFDEVDAASIGELQATQLKYAVMQSYGQDLQNERFFIELFDSDKSGTVNKEEFFQIMKFYEYIAYEKEWGKQPDPESGYEHPDPNANEPFEPMKLGDGKVVEAD